MSITKRVQQGFLRLPFAKKTILISSALLMISPVLPWYDNRNSVGVGESFIGLKGPLFLVGVFCLSFGAISFFNLFLPLLGKNFFKLRRKAGAVSAILGMQCLFLLIIANSVFFHPSFGLTGASKGTRFGMIAAFFATALMLIGGWLAHRKEKNGEEDEMEEVMTHATPVQQPFTRPVQTVQSVPSSAVQNPAPIRRAEPVQDVPSAFTGDPLTLDAKTRYKLMRARQRQSQAAKDNLWGGARQNETTNF